jgi:hypothetical protein
MLESLKKDEGELWYFVDALEKIIVHATMTTEAMYILISRILSAYRIREVKKRWNGRAGCFTVGLYQF